MPSSGSNNQGVPTWHPEYTREEDQDREKITLAHDLPLFMLMNAIGHVGWHLLNCPDIGSVTLVGARALPILDGYDALVPGELVLCAKGCCALDTGTFTIIADTEMLELLANSRGVGLTDLFPRRGKLDRFDGRACYVVPADDETRAPWDRTTT